MDYSKTVIISAADQQWVESPIKGIIRCQFEREQSESGWATSLVRYAPGTQFPHHSHPGGEQIYVLDGTFSDETGDYSADTYLQNPVGSSHNPYSKEGTLIFVRLGAVDSRYTHPIQIPQLSKAQSIQVETGPKDFLAIHHAYPGEELVKSNREIFLVKGNLIHHAHRHLPLSWFRISAKDELTFQVQEHIIYLERPLLK